MQRLGLRVRKLLHTFYTLVGNVPLARFAEPSRQVWRQSSQGGTAAQMPPLCRRSRASTPSSARMSPCTTVPSSRSSRSSRRSWTTAWRRAAAACVRASRRLAADRVGAQLQSSRTNGVALRWRRRRRRLPDGAAVEVDRAVGRRRVRAGSCCACSCATRSSASSPTPTTTATSTCSSSPSRMSTTPLDALVRTYMSPRAACAGAGAGA